MEKNKYYSLEKIIGENADYNMIIGERSNGKTYACLHKCVTDYFNGNGKFVYLRRWKEDIVTRRMEQLFNALESNNEIKTITNGQFNKIAYYRGKFYPANFNAEENKMVASKTNIGYAVSLTDYEHDKSISYSDVNTIIFDEFLTRQLYIYNEFVVFMNVLSTIIRDRKDVKIFMLGNTVNKFCPYFDEMGITNIFVQEQGTIDVYKYGDSELKIAVEYCGNIQSKKSNKYFAFDNPRLDMITSGIWEFALYPHLEENQKIDKNDIVFRFNIVFNKRKIIGEVVENSDGNFIFFHNRTSEIQDDELTYTINYTTKPNIRKCFMYRNDKLDCKIADFFNRRKVFFQSNDIGEVVSNYLKQCSVKKTLD